MATGSVLTSPRTQAATPVAQASSAVAAKPQRIIALEEHFMLPDFLGYLRETQQNLRAGLIDKVVVPLSDFGQRRLEMMDKNQVDFCILSLAGPGVQIEPDTRTAMCLARLANDRLANEMHR